MAIYLTPGFPHDLTSDLCDLITWVAGVGHSWNPVSAPQWQPGPHHPSPPTDLGGCVYIVSGREPHGLYRFPGHRFLLPASRVQACRRADLRSDRAVGQASTLPPSQCFDSGSDGCVFSPPEVFV
ncbi:hypothetical protein Bbelb_164010 [Branchiostoma belcheri]|nr:hypothetical protein Bbelb_164010 [Branchiostoma belcheri]